MDFSYEIDKLCFLLTFFLGKHSFDDASFLLKRLRTDSRSNLCGDLFHIISLIEFRLYKIEYLGNEINWETNQMFNSIVEHFQKRVVTHLSGEDVVSYEDSTANTIKNIINQYKDWYNPIC
jgi:hypothetical protein